MLIILPIVVMLFSCVKKTTEAIAPEFSLSDLKGNTISLSDYRGKVVFLNFWATWCVPCRAEIPGFVEVYEKYREKGMEIIGVSVDKLGPRPLLTFAEEFKISYPVVIATKQVINDYKPGRGIPVTFVIDKQRKIKHKHIGYMDKEMLVSYFLKLQNEQE